MNGHTAPARWWRRAVQSVITEPICHKLPHPDCLSVKTMRTRWTSLRAAPIERTLVDEPVQPRNPTSQCSSTIVYVV
jgi:hypothetical protein